MISFHHMTEKKPVAGTVQHVLSQAIDLSQVDAVTIGGVTYPLAAE